METHSKSEKESTMQKCLNYHAGIDTNFTEEFVHFVKSSWICKCFEKWVTILFHVDFPVEKMCDTGKVLKYSKKNLCSSENILFSSERALYTSRRNLRLFLVHFRHISVSFIRRRLSIAVKVPSKCFERNRRQKMVLATRCSRCLPSGDHRLNWNIPGSLNENRCAQRSLRNFFIYSDFKTWS